MLDTQHHGSLMRSAFTTLSYYLKDNWRSIDPKTGAPPTPDSIDSKDKEGADKPAKSPGKALSPVNEARRGSTGRGSDEATPGSMSSDQTKKFLASPDGEKFMSKVRFEERAKLKKEFDLELKAVKEEEKRQKQIAEKEIAKLKAMKVENVQSLAEKVRQRELDKVKQAEKEFEKMKISPT